MFSTSKNNASKAWSSRIMSKLGCSEEEWDKSSKYHSRIGRQFFSSFTSSLLSGSTILHNNKWRTKVLTSRGSLNSAGMPAPLHSKTELKAHAKNDRSKKKRQNPKLIPKANKHDLPHCHPDWFLFVCVWPWNNEAGLTFIIGIQQAAVRSRNCSSTSLPQKRKLLGHLLKC